MLRERRYKYVHYAAYRPQLFDLENDPEELHNRTVAIPTASATSVVLLDADGTIRYVNRAECEMLGYAREGHVRIGRSEADTWSDRLLRHSGLGRVGRGGEPLHVRGALACQRGSGAPGRIRTGDPVAGGHR